MIPVSSKGNPDTQSGIIIQIGIVKIGSKFYLHERKFCNSVIRKLKKRDESFVSVFKNSLF